MYPVNLYLEYKNYDKNDADSATSAASACCRSAPGTPVVETSSEAEVSVPECRFDADVDAGADAISIVELGPDQSHTVDAADSSVTEWSADADHCPEHAHDGTGPDGTVDADFDCDQCAGELPLPLLTLAKEPGWCARLVSAAAMGVER